MKAKAKGTSIKQSKRTLRRRKPHTESELPPEAQELRRQLREWDESFSSPAKRLAYIKNICARIAEKYQPEKIILFGSHAYGTPTPESDADLLVVMADDGKPLELSSQIRLALELYAPVDLHVRTVADVEKRLREGDMFIREIVGRGKVIYETQHA